MEPRSPKNVALVGSGLFGLPWWVDRSILRRPLCNPGEEGDPSLEGDQGSDGHPCLSPSFESVHTVVSPGKPVDFFQRRLWEDAAREERRDGIWHLGRT